MSLLRIACLAGFISASACSGSVRSAKEPRPLTHDARASRVNGQSDAGSLGARAEDSAASSVLQAEAGAQTAQLPSPAHSTSIGSPSNGRLQGGVPLPLVAHGLRFNERRDVSARYATVEVIAAIQRAAAVVAEHFPGSELVVNDLSLPAGGRIEHHGSHRAGRDADILFYLRGDDGGYTPSVGAPIDPQGIGFDFKDLGNPDDDVRVHFDAARTWRFVAALIEDADAPVQRIFVAEHLRDKLLAAAASAGARPETVALFADVTCQPSYPHDDHLHVRWFCSLEDLSAGCEDLPPLYPWRKDALLAADIAPALATRTRSVDPAPLTTNQEAARAVKRAKPHKDVMAFLTRRKAWERQPHPGRLYCP